MKSLIESLEPRQMFSSAATAAVVAFRRDLAGLNAPLPVGLIAYENIISKISLNLTIFNSWATDGPLVERVRVDFAANLHRLGADISVIKTLLNQDMVNLVIAEDELARHPSNLKLVNLVIADTSLLTQQAQAAIAPINNDCAVLLSEFYSDSSVIVNTHPIDITLGVDVNSLSGTLATITSEIKDTASHIQLVTAPYVISALAASTPQSNAA